MTYSSAPARREAVTRSRLQRAIALLGPWASCVLVALAVEAKVYLSIDRALEISFPGCEIDRRSVFLTDDQLQQAEGLSRVEIPTSLVYRYSATCEGTVAGTAYFDTHQVRTLPETLMVVVGPDERVIGLEVLEFREPEDYLPRASWYRQFLGRLLGPKLALRRDIQGVTGATLTARATTEAVRRTLALHRVIEAADGASDERELESRPASRGRWPR